MKILFVIHSLRYGGAERQLVELAKGLKRSLYDVHIACLENHTEGYKNIVCNAGINIHYFQRSSKYNLKPVFMIYRYIKNNKIEIIHTFENLGSLFGLTAAKLSGCPVVCSAIRSGRDKNFKIKMSTKFIARYADILVSNSNAGFTNRFKTRRPNFKVVYNGIDIKRFEYRKDNIQEIKNTLDICNFKKVVGMIASLSIHKDHMTLLNAANIVIKELPKTCFLIVGDGENRNLLEKMVRKLRLTNNVKILGYRNDVDRLINIFDVNVLLTNTDVILEGLSNSIIEAMFVGVPVVASSGGGTDEILENNVNGIVVKSKSPIETANAIISILTNDYKAKKIAIKAQNFAQDKFNIQRYVKEYEEIYKELLRN